ncbi:MAG: thermonuclease family protein, partial [Deltaproteobacteria bacterium]|nr:thermonuclease family protein [Deltaproteobacteria bacterium]
LGFAQDGIFQNAVFEISMPPQTSQDFGEEVKRLPYIFKDPIMFDKKIDPKMLRFGSNIDGKDGRRETYHTVRDIVSPEILVLNDGLKVRLLGVKKKEEKTGEAVRFLKTKTDRQKVFMKFDSVKYDDKDNLLCYLYLSNRTFLNAHLIKSGLADVDTGFDYRLKAKFLAARMMK